MIFTGFCFWYLKLHFFLLFRLTFPIQPQKTLIKMKKDKTGSTPKHHNHDNIFWNVTIVIIFLENWDQVNFSRPALSFGSKISPHIKIIRELRLMLSRQQQFCQRWLTTMIGLTVCGLPWETLSVQIPEKRTSSGCGGSVSFSLQLTSIDGLIRELIWLGSSDVWCAFGIITSVCEWANFTHMVPHRFAATGSASWDDLWPRWLIYVCSKFLIRDNDRGLVNIVTYNLLFGCSPYSVNKSKVFLITIIGLISIPK